MVGGVPMIVAMPPIFAAQATLSSTGLDNLDCFSSFNTPSTLVAMGNIIMAVAVFEIHMDIKPVANINPAINPASLVPVRFKIHKAMR